MNHFGTSIRPLDPFNRHDMAGKGCWLETRSIGMMVIPGRACRMYLGGILMVGAATAADHFIRFVTAPARETCQNT